MALKVAVIGLSDSHSEAPWGDPEWEKWGLAWDGDWAELQRTFEMHDLSELEPKHVDQLQHRTNLYVQDSRLPGTLYPFEEVAKTTGPYWISSIAYMLALAIHEGAEEIGLWGVDMDIGGEYEYQRANCEYLIGFARGRGIKVFIPDSSPLCTFKSPPDVAYEKRYGCLA